MALNFNGYGRDPGEETRKRWGNSIDGIFDAYMASKDRARQDTRQNAADQQNATDRSNAEKDRVFAAKDKYGFDPRQTTPDMYERKSAPQIGTPNSPSTTVGAPEQRSRGMISNAPGQAQAEHAAPDDIRTHVQAWMAKRDKERSLGTRKTEADISNTEADTELKRITAKEKVGVPGVPRTDGKAENELRDELTKLSGPFTQVRDSLGRIRAAASNPTAAGDLALIFNYMKVLDPGSTVREGEFATAQNSAGLPDRIRAKYNSVINGERLEAGQREDFVSRAEELYSSQASIQKQQENEYRRIAKNRNANPDNVIINRDLPPRAPAAGGDAESIRAAFKAGKISREQARSQIAALGGVRGR